MNAEQIAEILRTPNPKQAILETMRKQDPATLELYETLAPLLEQGFDSDSDDQDHDHDELGDDLVTEYNALVEDIEAFEQRHEADKQIIRDLQTQLNSQQKELAFVRELLSQFARAAGACPKCAGRKPSCQLCDGLGVPGYLKPREDIFLRMLRASNGSAHNH